MKIPYNVRDTTPANTSCDFENVGPGVDVVKVGSTSVSVTSAASVASAGLVPSIRNAITWCRNPPTSKHNPTTPVQTIITAAKTVSRASAVGPPESIIDTTSATSITVTAIARTSEPKGSPTRCATTSAW